VVQDVVGIRHDVAHGADEQRAFAARSLPKNVRDDVEGEARHFRRDGDRLPGRVGRPAREHVRRPLDHHGGHTRDAGPGQERSA
jgi:hypothetical protein